eukprot:jgi/Chrzof1/3447/Cz12g25220.t1
MGDTGGSEGSMPGTLPVAVDRRKLWMAAIKPPMYSVGVIPVLVGAAAAFQQSQAMLWARCWGLVIGAICIIAWLNLSNDAFDASMGVDRHKLESVVNLTGSRTLVMTAAWAFFALGLALLGVHIGAAHDSRVTSYLATAIACGYVYQGPPFRFSYKGLGEPLCFLAFGPLATTAFYLAMLPAVLLVTTPAPAAAVAAASTAAAAAAAASSTAVAQAAVSTAVVSTVASAAAALGGVVSAPVSVPVEVWILSVLVGITTSVILFCSHFHQIQGDVAAGKMSPLVRLGTNAGCQVLQAAVMLPYVILFVACLAGYASPVLLLATVVSVPAARSLLKFAADNHTVPAQIAPLKKYATIWHIMYGLGLVAGLVAPSVMLLQSV